MKKVLECAAIFSDHCVLQCSKPIRIWGIADDDMTIEIRLGGNTVTTVSERNRFRAELPAMEAGGPYELELSSQGQVYQRFTDVMIGEVWLAGGQSNMEYELRNDADGHAAMERARDLNIRFYYVGKRAYIDEYFYLAEKQGHWMTTSDEDLGIWSAVGFYFAENLEKQLPYRNGKPVTVGIIGCNWGGTSASAWQDRESICAHEDTRIYWDEYQDLTSHQDPDTYEKERIEYIAWHRDWQPRMDAYYAEHPNALWDDAQAAVGESKWPGPMGPKHEFRPCGLYETMLRRVTPYSLAGFIYYQGESDDHRPKSYYHLFDSLIRTWRRDFQDDTLPFLCVQLPMHHYISDESNDKWCYIREAQMQLFREHIVNGIAVAIDCGEYNNIHPIHKSQIGRRLALQALANVYGQLPVADAFGPLYKGHVIDSDGMHLTFEYAENGFIIRDGGPDGFELAGADGIYYPAAASVQDTEIILSSDSVPSPVSARYLWADYAEVTLYGANGLPVAPFRTNTPYEM